MLEEKATWDAVLNALPFVWQDCGNCIVIDASAASGDFVLSLPPGLDPGRVQILLAGQNASITASEPESSFGYLEFAIGELTRQPRIAVNGFAGCNVAVKLRRGAKPSNDDWHDIILQLETSTVDKLTVDGLRIEVQHGTIASAYLNDAGLHLNGGSVSAVHLAGKCVVAAEGVDSLTVADGAKIEAWTADIEGMRLPLHELPAGSALKVSGGKWITTPGLPDDCDVELDNGLLHVTFGSVRPTFRGWGGVRLGERSRLETPTFAPDCSVRADRGISLIVHSGVVTGPVGSVRTLELADAAAVLADGGEPLHVHKIVGSPGPWPTAELEGVSAYELAEADLQLLERICHRFRPWIEPSHRERTGREAAMEFGAPQDPVLRKHRAASYWGRMERLLTEQRAAGDTLSKVREAHLRARYLAANRHSRERIVLEPYRWIGYGERIARPILLYLAACIAVWMALRIANAGPPMSWWRLLGYLVVAPLTILRIDVALPNHPGALDTTLYSALKAIGVVLLASSLLTARRVGRGT